VPDVKPLDRNSRVYIAGHNGLAGSAIWRAMEADGFTDLVGARSSEVDLRDRAATFAYLHQIQPDVVVLAAARVGGIVANDTYPAEFLSENLRIQVNVMDSAQDVGVDRLLFLGSSCIYPKFAEQPIKESSLLTGELEPTNDAYAVAKIAGIMQVRAARKQYAVHWISAMPTNLYGPGDNFDLTTAHVLPALVRKISEAQERGLSQVTLWGSGLPLREFLHADDLGRAVASLLDAYDGSQPINVGSGHEVSIKNLSDMVARALQYDGLIEFDMTKPDGTPRKLLDSSQIRRLGWTPRVSLTEGIHDTIKSFQHDKGAAGCAESQRQLQGSEDSL